MIITKYILKRCSNLTILVLLAFVSLFSVFTALSEVSSLSTNFSYLSLIIYICALLPNFAYLLMPLAVLIGVMIAMLSLVNHSEYTVIRTSGVSINKIAKILFIFGLIFSIITFLLGEIVAPQADHFAKLYKLNKTSQTVSTQLQSGIWSKDGQNKFVNIKQVMPDNTILGINIFHYDSKFQLKNLIHAEEGKFDNQTQAWCLSHVSITNYTGQNIKYTNFKEYMWKTSIIPSYFSVLIVSPEDMSTFSLLKYINHLNNNYQSSQRYQIAFWNKLLYPIACISMSLIALAFVPNNARNISLSSRLFLGIIIGASFFFTTKIIAFMALLFNWNAVFTALGPTLFLFILGWYFVLKKK